MTALDWLVPDVMDIFLQGVRYLGRLLRLSAGSCAALLVACSMMRGGRGGAHELVRISSLTSRVPLSRRVHVVSRLLPSHGTFTLVIVALRVTHDTIVGSRSTC